MANAANREALESKDGGDVFAPPEHKLVIAEEDSNHANHFEHTARVALDDPDNVALLASLREHGWRRSVTMSVWKDGKGDGARWVVSNGRRRLTLLRIENARREKEHDTRGPIRPRVVLDDDPQLTEGLTNAMGKADPPMVIARRFVQGRGSAGAQAAAAALGITLAYGNDLAKILAMPEPALHAAVNARLIPVDVAARAVNGGSAKVREVIEKATDADGKVDTKTAARATREAVPVKKRVRPHPKALEKLEAALTKQKVLGASMEWGFILAIRFTLGQDVSKDVPAPVLAAMIDAAGWDPEKVKAPK